MSGIAQQPGPELGQTAKVKTPIPPASAQTLRDALGTRDTLPDHVALLDDLSPAYGGRVAQLTTDWHVGATISERYFITRHLGSGAMGEVYLAQDTLLDKQVALKVLHPDIAGDRSNVQRFL